MKRWLVALSLAVTSAAVLLPTVAEAKRLGGGGTSGMQRNMPSRAAPDGAPARPAQPAAVPQQAPGMPPAATPPKRSWMGPLAGIAAGLGLAALMSHFGMGAEFGNLLTMLLIGMVAFVAIRFLMRRFAPATPAASGLQFAGAGAPMGGHASSNARPAAQPFNPGSSMSGPTALSVAPAASLSAVAAPPVLPPGFDEPAFQRIAKLIFLRMQAANDAADLNDLRAFTTPEMFAAIKLDLQDRGANAQQTDVVQVEAQVLDFAHEADNQVVSVRFHGQVREEQNGPVAPFDEIWHLVKPVNGSRDWAIAGIQQHA